LLPPSAGQLVVAKSSRAPPLQTRWILHSTLRAMVLRRSDSEIDRRFGCRQDENLAVAHPPGAGDFDDFAIDFLGPQVVNPEGDFDLGQKGQRVLRFGV